MLIGLDMDGILANWIGSAIARIKMLWNLDLVESDFKMYNTKKLIEDKILDRKDPDSKYKYKWDIHPPINYKTLCPPKFFTNIKPYPKLRETIDSIAKEHEIVIITKPINWDYCPQEKINWLQHHLYGIDYSIIMVEDPQCKSLVQVDCMIDDDPRVIASFRNNKRTKVITIKRPWNLKYIEENNTLFVNELSDLPSKIDEVFKESESGRIHLIG